MHELDNFVTLPAQEQGGCTHAVNAVVIHTRIMLFIFQKCLYSWSSTPACSGQKTTYQLRFFLNVVLTAWLLSSNTCVKVKRQCEILHHEYGIMSLKFLITQQHNNQRTVYYLCVILPLFLRCLQEPLTAHLTSFLHSVSESGKMFILQSLTMSN